jgi:hypothetical protein
MKLPTSYGSNKTTFGSPSAPASSDTLMQFVPESVRPMVQAAQQMRADQSAAFQQQLAQQQAALDEQIAVKQAQLDKYASEIPEETRQYPAFQHAYQREKMLADIDYAKQSARLKMFGQPTAVVEQRLKQVDDDFKQYANLLKPFEETQGYEQASKNWQYLRGKKDILTNLNSLLGKAQDIYQQSVVAEREGNAELAASLRKQVTDFSSQSIAKALNSAITSSDAISVGELLTKFPQLVTAGQQSQLQKVSPFSPKMLIARWLDMDKKEKAGLADQFVEVFQSDPEGFLKNAIEASNIFSNTFNSSLKEQVINPTSPGVAKKMGAVPIQEIVNLISPSEQQKPNPLYTPNPFGTTISTGAGTMTSSAPQMSGQAFMQAPVKQPEQSPLNQRVGGPTLFRIEPRR